MRAIHKSAPAKKLGALFVYFVMRSAVAAIWLIVYTIHINYAGGALWIRRERNI